MAIMIKGIEMPENCIDCFAETYNECMVTWEYVASLGRPDWCPLVEVPTPHGRLGDVDALCEALIKRWNTADKNAERIISEVMADVVTPIVASAPTIIEAEE